MSWAADNAHLNPLRRKAELRSGTVTLQQMREEWQFGRLRDQQPTLTIHALSTVTVKSRSYPRGTKEQVLARYTCPEGHEGTTRVSQLIRAGCGQCGKLRRAAKTKGPRTRPTLAELNARIEARGVLLRAQDYNGMKKKTNFTCLTNARHVVFAHANSVLNGKGCKTCADLRLMGLDPAQHVSVYDAWVYLYAQAGIELLTTREDWRGSQIKARARCRTCAQEWTPLPKNFTVNGSGCPRCNAFSFEQPDAQRLYCVAVKYRRRILYKVGVAKGAVLGTRYNGDTIDGARGRDFILYPHQLVLDVFYDVPNIAFPFEQQMHTTFRATPASLWKTGTRVFSSTRDSELYNADVLGVLGDAHPLLEAALSHPSASHVFRATKLGPWMPAMEEMRR